MKRLVTGAAVIAALSMVGVSAHAGCAAPSAGGQQTAFHTAAGQALLGSSRFSESYGADRIVGTWHVSYTVEGNPFAEAFIQWHSDGTEWEDINLSVLDGNVCVGSWKPVDDSHVYRSHIGWLYTAGTLTGFFTETETDALSKDGNSYSGTNEQKIYNLSGTMLADVTGTSSATRIAP